MSKIKTINVSSGFRGGECKAISVWAVKVFEYLNCCRNNGRRFPPPPFCVPFLEGWWVRVRGGFWRGGGWQMAGEEGGGSLVAGQLTFYLLGSSHAWNWKSSNWLKICREPGFAEYTDQIRIMAVARKLRFAWYFWRNLNFSQKTKKQNEFETRKMEIFKGGSGKWESSQDKLITQQQYYAYATDI